MKTHVISASTLLGWLILPVLLFAGFLPVTRTAKAAGPCSPTYLHFGIITADETWCAGGDNTHYLVDNVTVQAGVTLTIAAGVTVDSPEANWSKYLIIQGHLDINGTLVQPVLLTRSPNWPSQNWSGLYFDGSQGDGSGTINYAIIDHAGSVFLPPGCSGTCGSAQTAIFVKDLPADKQVTINNSIIHNNTRKGLFVVDSTVNVTNTSFSQNTYPIWIEGGESLVTYSGNTFSDNAYPYYDNVSYTIQEDSIFIGQGALMGHDFSLPAQDGLDAYVLMSDTTLPLGKTMTVDPGVTLRTVGEKYLTIQGHLEVVGTPTLPVQFTGIPSSNPAIILRWGGLFFDGSQGDGSGAISHAIIERGGSNFLPPSCTGTCSSQTALVVKNLPVGKQVMISDSLIHDNYRKGLYVLDSTINLTNTTFSQNTYPIWIEGGESVITYSGNTFFDNAYPYYDNNNYTVQEDSIIIGSGALMGHNFSLPAQDGLDAYVYFTDSTVPLGTTMTVDPGVTLRMASERYLTVQGQLEAVGTPALPIRFSGIPSSNPTIMLRWGGLFFDGTAGDGGGTISHAIIERGGSNFLPPDCTGTCSSQTAVFVRDLPEDKQLGISNSTIQDSLNGGLYVLNSPTIRFNNNLITGGRIGAYLATNMTVDNLALTDQALDGVIVETGFSVQARHVTIARAGRSGFHVYTGGIGLLKNSILSQNVLAVWVEGTGQATLETNLADANINFKSGTVTEQDTINGPAMFEADGYHIQITSAAVGLGLPGLSIVDIDGDVRPSPSGSKPDLGADEISVGKYFVYVPLVVR